MNLSKKKYRVLEVTKGDDTFKFYPQVSYLGILWDNLKDGMADDIFRNTLKAANNVIADRCRNERARSVTSKKAHKFNEVFHKLKDD